MCPEYASNYDLGRSDERHMRDAELAKWKESFEIMVQLGIKKAAEIERLRSLLNRCAAELDNVPTPWAADLYREIKSLKGGGCDNG